MSERDPTRKEVPINPSVHSSKELWYAMNYQCSVAAGSGGFGVPEQDLVLQNADKHPSEVERMKKAISESPKLVSQSKSTEEPKK